MTRIMPNWSTKPSVCASWRSCFLTRDGNSCVQLNQNTNTKESASKEYQTCRVEWLIHLRFCYRTYFSTRYSSNTFRSFLTAATPCVDRLRLPTRGIEAVVVVFQRRFWLVRVNRILLLFMISVCVGSFLICVTSFLFRLLGISNSKNCECHVCWQKASLKPNIITL